MRTEIKGKNYGGVNWAHYNRVIDARRTIEDKDLEKLRTFQKENTSTDKPVNYNGKESK